MQFIEYLKAVFLGIIEGITEWLPISSTGHLILIDKLVSLDVSEAFLEMFLVVIQLGAIMAVPIIFWDRLSPFGDKKKPQEKNEIYKTWGKVIVGSMPAILLGLLLDDVIEKHFFNYITVAAALIFYGVVFVFVEKSKAESVYRINNINELTCGDALKIGLLQSLSLIPGTSRSGSTILGGMVSGVSREVSAEFSFFMAIPIMLGASALKCVKLFFDGVVVREVELLILFVGIITSFLVSLVVIKFLMDFVKRHDFKIFGYYRIALGIILLLFF